MTEIQSKKLINNRTDRVPETMAWHLLIQVDRPIIFEMCSLNDSTNQSHQYIHIFQTNKWLTQ